ncbi:MAG: ROK family protein, partial [Fidelibacterota bacterium]
SKGGRRPTILKFNGANSFVIGIDLGTTNIYGILADLNAEIIAERRIPTEIDRGSKDILNRTAEIINDLCQRPEVEGKRIFGVGMAVAGLINRRKNIVEFSPDFHWRDVDIKGTIGTGCELPILFDNVTRMMAMGELLYGIGTKYRDFIFINVGYGIGAGVVINREPLYGSFGMAGEFGHITLDKASKIQCDCGNYGCLEALASGHGIAIAARKALKDGADSILKEQCNGDLSKITAKMVADAAKSGESFSRNIFNEAAEYLGIGVATLVNLFSPHAIIIGGGVAQAGDILFDTVRKTVSARSIKNISREVDILPATFGMKAAAMGAVSVVLDNVLHLNPIE